jgi:hypothetical protein
MSVSIDEALQLPAALDESSGVANAVHAQQAETTDRSDGVIIRYIALAPDVSAHVTAMFLLDAGPNGVDEALKPDWGCFALALTGSWTWSKDGYGGPAQPLSFGSLFGPMDRAARLTSTPNAKVVGMTLSPLGWSQLVGLPASSMVGKVRDLPQLFEEAGELLEHLAASPDDDAMIARLTLWLRRRLRLAPPPDPHIERLSRALADERVDSIEGLSRASGLSVGMMDRLCPGIFGFEPGPLLERERFLRAFAQMQVQLLAGPLDGFHQGYPDRAQFERAFRHFMGQSIDSHLASPRLMLKAGIRAARAMAS